MNNTVVSIKINWVKESSGGKKVLPSNTQYYVITDSIEDITGAPTRWSLVLNIKDNFTNEMGERFGIGTAYFLVENAPSHLLTQGVKLNVYEGPKLVGIIEVL
ncbi:hypothetical protein [Providencia rettgeri]|uniref:hypothetical protein n=1 Tax=Providencia rettgeri TaxID=587 RepID=UPI0023AAB3E6|nr:hypothetical protein [Providencia rettgeri]